MIPAAVRASSDAGPIAAWSRRPGRGVSRQRYVEQAAARPPYDLGGGTAARPVGTAPHRQRRTRRGRRRIGEQFLHARSRRRHGRLDLGIERRQIQEAEAIGGR